MEGLTANQERVGRGYQPVEDAAQDFIGDV